MGLADVSRLWGRLGREDPLWAVLTERGKSGGRWSIEEFLATGEREVRAVLDHLAALGAAPRTGTALDFGCGAGRLTQGLAAAGFERAIGVDISDGMLVTATELARHREQCQFLRNDGPQLAALADDSVDLVYCCRVLQHLPPDLAHGYIREFFRVARPGAAVVFQIPTRPARTVQGLALRVLPRPILDRLRNGMEMHGTREEAVRGLIARCGGELLAVAADRSAGPRWESRLYLSRAGSPESR